MYLDPRTVIAIEELGTWLDGEPRRLEVSQLEHTKRDHSDLKRGIHVLVAIGDRRLTTFVPRDVVRAELGDRWLDEACDRLMKGLFLQLIDACATTREEGTRRDTEPPSAPDKDEPEDRWAVVVTCAGEREQVMLLEHLSGEGFEVKALPG